MSLNIRRGLCLAMALAALILVGGCSKRITPGYARGHMSPELTSMAMTSQQMKNRHARTVDTELRQVWDDLDSLLLLDRPSRMTRYPVP